MVAHNKSQVEQFSLEPNDARDLATLCGQHDQHLQMIEEHLNLKISNRGNRFRLEGDKDAVKQGQHLLKNLYAEVQKEKELSPESVHLSLSNADEPMPFDTNAQD
ncbi:MAG: hypothetical protein OXE99_13500, partial [Cellvibrionales bacterium]|nr:hypothetical protein [Cellvibrionales bacterium]